jgi:hypothetical protein
MKRLIIFFLLSLTLLSCKKSTPAPANTTSNTGTPTSKLGYLVASKAYTINISTGTLSLQNIGVNAQFVNNIYHPTGTVFAGDVYVGTDKLSYNRYMTNAYGDTSSFMQINPTTWKVTGMPLYQIPGFVFTDNDSFPGYTGFMNLPDTIYKSQGLVLHISGVSGANSVNAFLDDFSNGYQYSQSVDSVLNTYTITISAANLSGLSLSTSSASCDITINIDKNNDQTISGSDFRFTSEKQIFKRVYIKP